MFPHGNYRRFLSVRVALFLLRLSFFGARSPRLTLINLNLNGTFALFKNRLRIIDLHHLLIGDAVFRRTPR